MNLKSISTILIAAVLVAIGASFKTMTKEQKAMIDTQHPKLHYLVRQPKVKTEKTPLVVLLHGVGSNEQNMFSLAEAMPENFLVVSARGPLTIGNGGYAWFQVQFSPEGSIINEAQAEQSRKDILSFIKDIKTVEDFDLAQVYLLGFSQGGIMSYSTYLTEPEKIAGIAVMSGRLLKEIKPLMASDERLKNVNIFVSHGTQDRVLTFQYAIDATEYLASRGIQPKFHQYNEDHTISPQMLNDAVNWLKTSSTK